MKHQLELGVRTWLHMNHITHTVQRRLSRHLEHYDLTLAQFGVLAHLQAAPHISQQALADWLFVTKGRGSRVRRAAVRPGGWSHASGLSDRTGRSAGRTSGPGA